jgi:hypothetical protein
LYKDAKMVLVDRIGRVPAAMQLPCRDIIREYPQDHSRGAPVVRCCFSTAIIVLSSSTN